MKIVVIGDVAVKTETFVRAAELLVYPDKTIIGFNWEMDRQKFTERIKNIEKNGPASECLPKSLLEEMKGADLLMVHWAPVSKQLVECSNNLKIIAVCRGGMDNIDLEAVKMNNIKVINIIRNAEPVAEYTVGLIVSEMRNIARGHEALKQGIWKKNYNNSGNTSIVKGKTVGLVGFGNIGKLVAKKLSGFDVNIQVCDPFVSDEEITKIKNAQKVTIDVLCKESDIISLHMRVVKETENIINKEMLSVMKPTTYLINTSRAELIEEEALYDSLKYNKIAGAALDVFWKEPIPENSRFLYLDNVTLTPHLAGTTIEALGNSPYLLIYVLNDYLKTNNIDSVV